MSRPTFRFPPYLPSLLTSGAIALLVLLFDHILQERYRTQERADVLHRLSVVRARLEGEINSRLYIARGLKSYVVTHPNLTSSEFRRFARNLIAGQTAIRGVRLLPESRGDSASPAAQEQWILGQRNLVVPLHHPAAQRAPDNHELVVSAPAGLGADGDVFVGRVPIYLRAAGAASAVRSYWGMAIILLDARVILAEAGLNHMPPRDLRMALRRISGTADPGTVFYGDPTLFDADPVVLPVTFASGAWELAAEPADGWAALVPNRELWRAGGVLLALLAGALTWLWARYPVRLRNEVERATGELRSAQDQLESKVAERTSELVSANAALRESETRLAEAQQIARIGNWEWNVRSNDLYWSDEVFAIFGLDRSTFDGSYDGYRSRIHPEDRERVEQAVMNALRTGRFYEIEHRVVLPDGGVRIVHQRARVDADENGDAARMAGTMQDITERKHAEIQLERMAYHDSLTGLPNRHLLRDRLRHAMDNSRRGRHQVALLFLDLDRFKNVNDSLGHDAGDRLLVQVAQRLSKYKREEDTLARLGGDEFTMVIEGLDDPDHARLVAIKLRDALAERFLVDGLEVFVSASIGISMYPGDGEDVDSLMKHADTAMYRAKELGRDGHQFFSAEMSERADERLRMETSLFRAQQRDELDLYYQPVIDLASGHIVAFEALARWRHPAYGMLGPRDFIPLAEETGLAVAIGHHILRMACGQSRRWRLESCPPVRLLVNVSPRQLADDTFAADVELLLRESGLGPESLGLEITEHLLLEDDHRVNAALQKLHDMRVPVAIDDFGTGHSAFSYLKRLAISTLKIDRSFITDVAVDASDAAIVEAIIIMGHKLGLNIIAEGVETASQAEFLRAAGCDAAQGWVYSHAVSADQVPDLILRHGVLADA